MNKMPRADVHLGAEMPISETSMMSAQPKSYSTERVFIEQRPGVLPALGKDGAPLFFEGTEFEDIKTWLRDFEMRCDAAGVPTTSRCSILPRYVSLKVRKVLNGIPEFLDSDWEGLKNELEITFYSTAMSMLFTKDDLNRLVQAQRNKPMTRPQEFETYLQEFRMQSQYLTEKGLLTPDEKATSFWKGFPLHLRESLMNRMFRLDPTNATFRNEAIPFRFDLQLQAARTLFNASSFDAPERFQFTEQEINQKRNDALRFQSAQERASVGNRQIAPTFLSGVPEQINPMWGNVVPNTIPTVRVEPKKTGYESELDLVIDRLQRMDVKSSTYYTSYTIAVREGFPLEGRVPQPMWGRVGSENSTVNFQQPMNAPRQTGPTRQTYPGVSNVPRANVTGGAKDCFYCGMFGHRASDCKIAVDHANRGWIIRDGPKILYANGESIQGPYGKKKCLIVLEKYNQQPVTQFTNSFEVDEEMFNSHSFQRGDLESEGTESYDVNDELYDRESDVAHHFTSLAGETDAEIDQRVINAIACGLQAYEKGKPGRPTGFTTGPKGKPVAVNDKFAKYRDPKPQQRPESQTVKPPTSGTNNIPIARPTQNNQPAPPKPNYQTQPRPTIQPAMPNMMPVKIQEDRANDRMIAPEDVQMKDVSRTRPQRPKNDKNDGVKTVRQTDFAMETDPYKVVNEVLNSKMPMNMSFKQLMAISPLAASIVNRGTKMQQQTVDGLNKTMQYVMSGATNVHEIDDAEVSEYPAYLECSSSEVDREFQTYELRQPESDVVPVDENERVAYHRKIIKFHGDLNGNRVKFMIDTGSEIDVCPWRVWQSMENPIPYRTDMRLMLKGVNGPSKPMKGVMENCEVKVGSMTILSNMHLNDDGPDCIILGQPFLHRARFEHLWIQDRPTVRLTGPGGSIEFPYEKMKSDADFTTRRPVEVTVHENAFSEYESWLQARQDQQSFQ